MSRAGALFFEVRGFAVLPVGAKRRRAARLGLGFTVLNFTVLPALGVAVLRVRGAKRNGSRPHGQTPKWGEPDNLSAVGLAVVTFVVGRFRAVLFRFARRSRYSFRSVFVG